jgi:hypothetical protein
MFLFGAPSIRRAMYAFVVVQMMYHKVLIEKVFCGAEVALKFFRALLVGFFVAFPVSLFAKGFRTSGAEVSRYYS